MLPYTTNIFKLGGYIAHDRFNAYITANPTSDILDSTSQITQSAVKAFIDISFYVEK